MEQNKILGKRNKALRIRFAWQRQHCKQFTSEGITNIMRGAKWKLPAVARRYLGQVGKVHLHMTIACLGIDRAYRLVISEHRFRLTNVDHQAPGL